jgi:hypothetical protein
MEALILMVSRKVPFGSWRVIWWSDGHESWLIASGDGTMTVIQTWKEPTTAAAASRT